ncbi:N-acetylglucosamine-6-phosphate deacetylase [Aestuariibius insulae]|uniref:N-acetylglucosamine-6-phosphate deacetylase n=1 Tax=Aestuariibius insulae TaxID=2058287 RepID=UPI00345E28D8
MSGADRIFIGGRIFDGNRLRDGIAACFRDGVFTEYLAAEDVPQSASCVDLDGDLLSPGYVDLQVNGGGGIMFNDDPSTATLKRIADAHRRLGAVTILPTLITDTREKTEAAIDAATSAISEGIRWIGGLHLEGPHLSVTKKGAHDTALIRPMDDADLEVLLEAKRDIPVLKVTIAPEAVTSEQVTTMARAGILVSLGHTNADFETCLSYARAGARCVTHLFNAMSQLGSREPGLVGAALSSGTLSAGLIADGVHVHPALMRMALASKAKPGGLFLVSDSMAVAGTEQTEFFLDGRRISRKCGRLTLDDGTLAGADLDLTTAIRVLTEEAQVPLDAALRAATTVSGDLIGLPAPMAPGRTRISDMIRISSCLRKLTPLDHFQAASD